MNEQAELARRLAAPFDQREVRFKPCVVSGNRALAQAYVDARVIEDRLDDVMGVENWHDGYDFLPDGSVVCSLSLRFGDEWITKTDVGGPSEQPDGGDRVKAAVSDALKRAAVKFGVGRYLYRIPGQWLDYDPKRKQFLKEPTLPAPVASVAKRRDDSGNGKADRGDRLPANGAELKRRVEDYDARLAREGLCQAGELIRHVLAAGVKAGHGTALETWSRPAMSLAAAATKAFEARLRESGAPGKEPGRGDGRVSQSRPSQVGPGPVEAARSMVRKPA